jgi:predicted  nucleic acid-binding Zn-ribbon protein
MESEMINPNPDEPKPPITEAEREDRLDALEGDLYVLKDRIEELEREAERLRNEVDSLEREVDLLKTPPPPRRRR